MVPTPPATLQLDTTSNGAQGQPRLFWELWQLGYLCICSSRKERHSRPLGEPRERSICINPLRSGEEAIHLNSISELSLSTSSKRTQRQAGAEAGSQSGRKIERVIKGILNREWHRKTGRVKMSSYLSLFGVQIKCVNFFFVIRNLAVLKKVECGIRVSVWLRMWF